MSLWPDTWRGRDRWLVSGFCWFCLSCALSTKRPRWGSSTPPACWGLLRGVLILGQNEPTVLKLFRADLKMQRFFQTEQTETLTVSWSTHDIWRCSSCFLLWDFAQRQWQSGCQRPGGWKFPVSSVAGLKWGTVCEINAVIMRSLELVLTHHRKQRSPAVQCADCSQAVLPLHCSPPEALSYKAYGWMNSSETILKSLGCFSELHR